MTARKSRTHQPLPQARERASFRQLAAGQAIVQRIALLGRQPARDLAHDRGRQLAEWARGGTTKATTNITDDADDLMAWDSKLATAALQGTECLRETWSTVPKHLKKSLEAALRNRHQPTAEKAPA
jgi:aminoglycoside phosphotransferase